MTATTNDLFTTLQTILRIRNLLGHNNDNDATLDEIIAAMGINGLCSKVLQEVREHMQQHEAR